MGNGHGAFPLSGAPAPVRPQGRGLAGAVGWGMGLGDSPRQGAPAPIQPLWGAPVCSHLQVAGADLAQVDGRVGDGPFHLQVAAPHAAPARQRLQLVPIRRLLGGLQGHRTGQVSAGKPAAAGCGHQAVPHGGGPRDTPSAGQPPVPPPPPPDPNERPMSPPLTSPDQATPGLIGRYVNIRERKRESWPQGKGRDPGPSPSRGRWV